MERRVITTDMMEEDIRIEGTFVPSVWVIILVRKSKRKI